ncbi:MAG: [citrate (pro-3S)-lyase] ligase [Aerococcaceae bacterium]|nr:[citrate (pro-3S)-lyase] ligase [Aerococcaceae bacterium]
MFTAVSSIALSNPYRKKQVETLLAQANLQLDPHLDYTCGIFDAEDRLIATGSCYRHTLRCFAIHPDYQGEGLLNQILSHLLSYQAENGYFHSFVYTKVSAAPLFLAAGFHEIVRVNNDLVFLENRKTGFSNYLQKLATSLPATQKNAAIVMNANPFSLGHLHLIETACAQNDWVHVFIVREDSSVFPYDIRKKLILDGTAHLTNISYHDTGDYLISHATFPSYFIPDSADAIRIQAELDIELFIKIARQLNITHRYVGEEPFSQMTAIYNQVMQKRLTEATITLHILPRLEVNGQAVSASHIRQAIQRSDYNQLALWVSPTTLAFLKTPEAQPIIHAIQNTGDVIHH